VAPRRPSLHPSPAPDAASCRTALFAAVNWIRTFPYVKAWHRDYADRALIVVGVHALEFEFGKRAEHIDRGIRDHGFTYAYSGGTGAT